LQIFFEINSKDSRKISGFSFLFRVFGVLVVVYFAPEQLRNKKQSQGFLIH